MGQSVVMSYVTRKLKLGTGVRYMISCTKKVCSAYAVVNDQGGGWDWQLILGWKVRVERLKVSAAGNAVDSLQLADGRKELPSAMDYATLLPLVEELRQLSAPLFGIAVSDQPRVALVAPPKDYQSSSQDQVEAQAMDLLARISTPGRIHHAFTGTGTIALACAAQVEDSVPYRCIPEAQRSQKIRIGHPGGVPWR
eukprot:Skav220859  [mRNA]  locus=scaffold193:36977:41974:+ [translate_table: standard]